MVAGALAFAAIAAIVDQCAVPATGPHPSPMFGSIVTIPAPAPAAPVSPLPRPAAGGSDPVGGCSGRTEGSGTQNRDQGRRDARQRAQGFGPARVADPLTNLVKATSTAPAATSSIPRPRRRRSRSRSRGENTLSPGGSRRVAAVQRALTEYGYGQLKPTGTIGPDTQAAIVQVRARRVKIPATGQMNDRLVHELSHDDRSPDRLTQELRARAAALCSARAQCVSVTLRLRQ